MFARVALFTLFLGGLAAADPAFTVQTRIVREYQENGESKVQQFNPTFRVNGNQLQVGDQTVTPPAIPDETAQKMFSTLMEMFTAQAAPMLSQFSQGKPLELRLEIPNINEKLTIEVTPEYAK